MRNTYTYWVTGILGILFIVAPFLLGYVNNTSALWTSVSAGVLVIIMSGLEALNHERRLWEYWVAGIVGLFAIVAPFVVGFSNHAGAMWTSVILGFLTFVAAGLKIYTKEQS